MADGEDDDVPLILTWEDASCGLLTEETESATATNESKFIFSYVTLS
uniref:Uncharacterized protein n=1 Tax=Anguilla anguilla TaxID=7936 RepID=A0A0E9P8H2_ANGAN